MMHPSSSRTRRAWLVTVAVVTSAVLAAGCGSSDSSSGAKGGSNSFKVAILLGGTINSSTYNQDANNTANAIRKQVGADVTVSQSVPLPNQADVYSQFARQGYDLVIGWGGEFTDGAASAAARFPKTQFLVVNSTIDKAPNLSSIDENFEQWQFLAGYVAARLSKSHVVGWIGGQCFPATAAQLNGTKQGAQYADKKVKFLSTFTGDFNDPTKAQEAAQAMIDNHADALVANLDRGTVGMIKAAQDSGNVDLILEWIDNHDQAPAVIASDVLKTQTRLIVPLVKTAKESGLGAKHYQYKLPENWGPAILKTSLIPQNVYNDAMNVQKKVASGDIKVNRIESCPK